MATFIKNTLKGFNAKLITESIFRDSNYYETYPFGYESAFSRLLNIRDNNSNSDTFLQLRSMPDLLIVDSNKKEVFLVECKYRNTPKLDNLRLEKSTIEKYKKYWRGCILVIITPLGELLYAQTVDNLDIDNKKSYGNNIYFDLNKEFKPFIEMFPKVDKKIVNKYRTFITTISDQN